MTEHKVLVFPAGTEIAFEIHNALRNSKFVRLYGATSVPCHADFVFENCADGLPFVDDPNLIDELNKVIDQWGIEYIYPAHDSALLRLTADQLKLHASVVTSALNTVAICRSKNNTYCFLDGAKYLPKYWLNANDVTEFPVFVKPDIGQGSEGAMIVKNRDKLWEILESNKKDYAICEYLPGDEYTVDCFTDLHGKLRYVGQRTRERIRSGIAVRSRFVVTDPWVQAIAENLNSHFIFNGAWFFQVKEDKSGVLKLMEVAPRIAGTMGLSRNLGVNLPLLTLFNMWGVEVEIMANDNSLLLDRAFISRYQTDLDYDNVFVDLDDTLIVRGKTNPYLIAFLYQAKEKGKKIILLTKHGDSAIKTLQDHSIDIYLFDSIVGIPVWDKKCLYVRERSIFIDDSFLERKSVHQMCGIPVFDVDGVESLFDWSG